jgi:hypothetical protein
VWNAANDVPKYYQNTKTVHQMTGLGVDYLLKNSMLRRTLDNVTAVMISFKGFKHAVFGDEQGNQGLLSGKE